MARMTIIPIITPSIVPSQYLAKKLGKSAYEKDVRGGRYKCQDREITGPV